MKIHRIIVFTFLFQCSVVLAQQSEPSMLSAHRISDQIVLDGLLNEPSWQEAQKISNFTQRDLDEGAPATERTEVAVLYSNDAVYIGLWAYDSQPDRITATKMERDFGWGNEDNFVVVIDPYDDDRNGYFFTINPNGAMSDALIADNGFKFNLDWDGVWDTRTTVNDMGWFAEIEIPFSTMRLPDKEEQVWGINFERNIRHKLEEVLWQGWSRDTDIERLSKAGTLTGIKSVKSRKHVDVLPYVLGGVEKERGENTNSVFDAGLDANYLLSPTVRLNVTVNPDFAQVEDDRLEINLSRFSLFFPEKRKFFLEGQEFFDFAMGPDNRPFYSRRIGLSKDGKEIPIIAGARVLGKTGNSALGAMVMQTAEKGDDPSTNYSVVRWKQDILDESYVGFLGVNKIDNGEINTTYAGDFKYSVSDMFGNKDFGVGVLWAQTFTSDASEKHGNAQRFFMQFPNDLVDWIGVAGRVDERFNPEVGFLRRESFRTYYTRLDLNPRPSFLPWMRKWNVRPIEIDYYEDDNTGQMESFMYVFRPFGIYLSSGDYIRFEIERNAERIPEEFEIFDGVIVSPATYWFTEYEIVLSSYGSRTISFETDFSWGNLYNAKRTEYSFYVSWRLSKYASLSAEYEQNDLSFPEAAFTTRTTGGRIKFAFSPKLFGSLYGQWTNEEDEALLNFRINWIPNPGSDVYFVVNQRWGKESGVFLLQDTTILSKIIWRFEV